MGEQRPIGPAIDRDFAGGEFPLSVLDNVRIDVAAPVVESDIGDHKKVQAPLGVFVIDEVDLVRGRRVANMGQLIGGPGRLFGARKDRHDLVESLVQAAVADVHRGGGAKKFPDLRKSAGIAVGVVPGYQITNRLTGEELPKFGDRLHADFRSRRRRGPSPRVGLMGPWSPYTRWIYRSKDY